MSAHVPRPSSVRRARPAATLAALCAMLTLSACGSSASKQTTTTAATRTTATAGRRASTAGTPPSCPATVMRTLGRIVEHVYHEGISSERTIIARRILENSSALRAAARSGDSSAVRAAAAQLLASGRITALRVSAGGRTLADLGKASLTPLHGTLTGAQGTPIASYLTSVWSDEGFIAEASGVIEGHVALSENGRLLPGSFPLGHEHLADSGTLTRAGVRYLYTSFSGEALPSGSVRIYLLRPASSAGELCGRDSEGTVIATLEHVAHLIYEGEHGAPARRQVTRMQHDSALLAAVAARNPAATEAAVKALLNEHVVRLRVLAPGGELLSDVGGPYVLAPVRAQLALGGRRIGSFVLSVQDDEGYEKLLKRLEGLDVVIYMGSKIVKNSLGPVSGEIPASGPYTYNGRPFRVFTVYAKAFPSGPLVIRVLVPVPYLAQPIS